ncbi:MAG TPA: ABC transporter substrate-binding protein [Stellaceae bacterium]|nr:ABC transporter substrate-binding protein [Stellaceae bacterium]
MQGRIFGACVLLLALLLGVPGSAFGTTLTVAYIPIMPMAQLYVMQSEGWTKQAGLDLRLTKFSSGPAMVQAMASGKYDVMYVGIGPAMVARANGVPLKVVASAVVEQIALIAQGALAKDAAGAQSAADAIRAFTAEHHRKPKIATLPKGSVPDLVLRYWLERRAKLPIDSVEIVGMGEDRVQQALLTRSVDGASILEPIVTIVRERMPDARILVAGGAMFPDQPGAVVAVTQRALKDDPAAITQLVALHIRATELLHSDPARAARDIYPFLGQGLVPLATIERAVRSPVSHFVSDPRKIVDATREMRDFSKEIGTLAKPVPVKELFDTAIYQAAQRQQ